MKKLALIIIASTAFTMSPVSFAASHAAAPTSIAATASLPIADAEIRKVDLENKKVTLKHGEIKNLDMPGMTMVFQVKDATMLANIKAGDKVMFTADKINGAYTLMSIEKAK
jgi:Cu(I)/Ag(I) efflux system protein CusF